jgi:hypothetical protein
VKIAEYGWVCHGCGREIERCRREFREGRSQKGAKSAGV